jgi:hypothetical protein
MDGLLGGLGIGSSQPQLDRALREGADDPLPPLAILNQTGYTIVEVHIRRGDRYDNYPWSGNLLKDDAVIPNGESYTVTIPFVREEDGVWYDIGLEDADGDSYLIEIYNVMEGQITFKFSDYWDI